MVKKRVPTSLPRSPCLARSGIATTIIGIASFRGTLRSLLTLSPLYAMTTLMG
jgi:hypothetical protein